MQTKFFAATRKDTQRKYMGRLVQIFAHKVLRAQSVASDDGGPIKFDAEWRGIVWMTDTIFAIIPPNLCPNSFSV